MAQRIQFIYLTQSEYDGLTKQESCLYFTQDTHRIYRGSDLYAATSFDLISVSEIDVSDITVNGNAVSLEGHSHSSSDIFDFTSAVVQAGTSVFASASHTHDGLSGLTSSTISKDSAWFDSISASTVTFENLIVTGDVSMSLSQVQFESIMASEISVNGSSVALEGHTHSIDDIEDYEDNTFWITGSINVQTLEIQVDQSFSDAVEAADAGKHIRAKLDYTGNGDYVCPWANVIYNSNGSAVKFDFHIMLDTNALNLDQNWHPYLISVTWDSNGFTVRPYELSETSHEHIELSGITESSISKDSATFNGVSASTATFGSIMASEITVNGSSVSLEGHLHSIPDISGLSSILSGITESSIQKSQVTVNAGTFDNITADIGNFRLISVSGSADFAVNNVQASAVSVNGIAVSLEGHTHSFADVTGLSSSIDFMSSQLSSISTELSSLANGLSGQTFDFSEVKGLYLALSSIITIMGGSISNFPTFNQ